MKEPMDSNVKISFKTYAEGKMPTLQYKTKNIL